MQINDAIKNLEEKTLNRIGQTEDRVVKMVQGQDDKIQEMQKTTAALLDRVRALEDRPAASGASTATGGGGDRLALVVGGWKRDTHRDLILSDFQSLVKELELGSLLDGSTLSPAFAPVWRLCLSWFVVAKLNSRPGKG